MFVTNRRLHAILFINLVSVGAHAQWTCPSPGAMSGGGSSIGGIASGSLFTGTESWFDLATQTLQVQVIPPASGDCRVEVQGMTPLLKSSGKWIVEVPVSPGMPPQWQTAPGNIYQGKRVTEIPHIGALMDLHRVHKPLVYEVIDIATGTVLHRTKIVIIDKRRDFSFNPSHKAASELAGAGVELSQAGADKLERVHASSLPQPDLAAFNAALTERFKSVVQSSVLPTKFGDTGKACIPLTYADADFLNTNAYASALLTSAGLYLTWKAADETCQNSIDPATKAIACAAAKANCVRDGTPTAGNFELCVGRVTGTSTKLTLAKVNSTDLSITNAAPLNSQISLGRLDGTVDGTLSDLFIRWSDNHESCALRSTANLSDADDRRPAIDAWRACSGLEVDAAWATSGDVSHNLPHAQQLLNATATARLPLFQLDPGHPRNAGKGACTGFRDHVLKLLDLYYPAMQTALDNSWLPQHKTAMDLLTSRWETGANETMKDVTLTMLPWPVEHRSGDRLAMYYSTAAVAPLGSLTAPWSQPGDFPCFDRVTGAPPYVLCSPGKSSYGGDFDASYTVTTNTMNQVIRERYLNLGLKPTFDQLGIRPPSGKTGTDTWQVDGTWLSTQFPATLGDLGNTKLTMKLLPTRQPFLYIHPETAYWFVNGVYTVDPDNYIPGMTPLTYQMGQFKIILEGDQTGPDGTSDWLEFLVDLYDANFKMDTSEDARQNVLVPSYSGYKSYLFTLVKNQLSGCPVSPIGRPFDERCGELLTELVGKTVKPLLDSMLLDLVKGYPAPLFFDAAGKATETRRFKQTQKYFEAQVMTFYGTLE